MRASEINNWYSRINTVMSRHGLANLPSPNLSAGTTIITKSLIDTLQNGINATKNDVYLSTLTLGAMPAVTKGAVAQKSTYDAIEANVKVLETAICRNLVSHSNGICSNGNNSNGTNSNGSNSNGKNSYGSKSNGSNSNGKKSTSTNSYGCKQDSKNSNGTNGNGYNINGWNSNGTCSNGSDSNGSNSNGSYSNGTNSNGNNGNGYNNNGSYIDVKNSKTS